MLGAFGESERGRCCTECAELGENPLALYSVDSQQHRSDSYYATAGGKNGCG